MQARAGCLAGYYLVGEGLPFDRALARCCVHDLNPIVIGLANRKPMCADVPPCPDLNR